MADEHLNGASRDPQAGRLAGKMLVEQRRRYRSSCAVCGIEIIGMTRRRFCGPTHQRASYRERAEHPKSDGSVPTVDEYHGQAEIVEITGS